MTKPILRWAGSKKKLLPILTMAKPKSYLRYLEPFVGSAVLYLQLPKKPAILGDLNKDLIDAYEVLRSHPRAVWNRISKMPTSSEYYYQLRQVNGENLKDLDRAARFIYLNRFCFNGVYRTNLQGKFNVSRGLGDLRIPEWEVFKEFAGAIENANLLYGDFEVVMNKAKRGDFIYLDPPYAEAGKRDRGEYGVGSFKEFDIDRLMSSMENANRKGAKVLLSYSNNKKLMEKLDGWNVKEISVFRNVAGFVGMRRNADEIIVSNYKW